MKWFPDKKKLSYWTLGQFNLPLAHFPCLSYVLPLLLLPRLTRGHEVILTEFVKHVAVPSKLLIKTWGILLRAFQKSIWASWTGSPLPFATPTTSINNSDFSQTISELGLLKYSTCQRGILAGIWPNSFNHVPVVVYLNPCLQSWFLASWISVFLHGPNLSQV